MAKIRKPSSHESSGSGKQGIFGVNKPVAVMAKVAGLSHGYDPFTKSIALKGVSSPAHTPVPKKVYVGHGGGSAGAVTK